MTNTELLLLAGLVITFAIGMYLVIKNGELRYSLCICEGLTESKQGGDDEFPMSFKGLQGKGSYPFTVSGLTQPVKPESRSTKMMRVDLAVPPTIPLPPLPQSAIKGLNAKGFYTLTDIIVSDIDAKRLIAIKGVGAKSFKILQKALADTLTIP